MSNDSIRLVQPRSLNDLSAMIRRWSEGKFLAGGTGDLWDHDLGVKRLYNLSAVPELQRIQRSDRSLELGAAVPLSRVIRLENHMVPPIISEAVALHLPVGIRPLATVGGNLAGLGDYVNLAAAWELIDTRVELRMGGSSRWYRITELPDVLDPDHSAVLLTRVRFPMFRWNHTVYGRFSGGPGPGFSLAGGAIIESGEVSEARVVVGLSNGIVRSLPLLANDLVSRSKLMTPKQARQLVRQFLDASEDLPVSKNTLEPALVWYISQLRESRWTWKYGSDDLARVIRRR